MRTVNSLRKQLNDGPFDLLSGARGLSDNHIERDDIAIERSSNRFIGGLTGRSGTSWMRDALVEVLKGEYVGISEIGFFSLSQYRHAPFEFYPGANAMRAHYLRYFYRFVSDEGYDRRKVFNVGPYGLNGIVPRHAIRLAFEILQDELATALTLPACNVAFGNFYSYLLNYHSLKQGGTLNWISKEPSYGKHAADLYRLIPDCRLIVMVRDGRDAALSMLAKGWADGSLYTCFDRWKTFTEQTLDGLSTIPQENFLMVTYEEMSLAHEETITKVLTFLGIADAPALASAVHAPGYASAPLPDNLNKWERKLSDSEKRYFETMCGDVMHRLGYRR